MYLISLTYIRPVEEVDRFLDEHRQYLKKQYEAGSFLLSGRKEPRTGGVIISGLKDPEELERILNEDPFRKNGVAEYEVIRFTASMTSPELQFLKE